MRRRCIASTAIELAHASTGTLPYPSRRQPVLARNVVATIAAARRAGGPRDARARAATRSTRRSPPRSRSPSSSRSATASAPTSSRSSGTGGELRRTQRVGPRAGGAGRPHASRARRRCPSAAGKRSRFPARCRAGSRCRSASASCRSPTCSSRRSATRATASPSRRSSRRSGRARRRACRATSAGPSTSCRADARRCAGELFRVPARWPRTLDEIAASGGEAFYRGELAQAMARHASAHGGACTTLDDLAAHTRATG